MSVDAPYAIRVARAQVDRLDLIAIGELIGIAKGVIADGHVNQAEAGFLFEWMQMNRAASQQWPTKPPARPAKDLDYLVYLRDR